MGFATELKTIMKLDDKDWKKTLESVKQVEKQYFKQSSSNSKELIRLTNQLETKQKEFTDKQKKQLQDIKELE
jgi:hypothetical protein